MALPWSLAGAVLAFQLVFVGWIIVRPGGEETAVWFDDLAFVAAPSLAALLTGLVALRSWGSPTGYAWGLISLGLLMAAFGETAWGVQELGMRIEVPFPSVADIGYLGMYPPVFLGLLQMPQAPVSGLRRLKLGLDTFIAMLAIAVISWYLILASLLGESGDSALSSSIAAAYPFADLGLVFAVLVLLARAERGPSMTALALLGGGFAAIAFSDSLYTYLTSVGGYASGHYVDAGWMLGYNLVTIAALVAVCRPRFRERRSPDEEQPPAFWLSLIPYAGLLLLASVHAFPLFSGYSDRPSAFLEGGTLAVVVLISARQMITIYENGRLNRDLADLSAALETRLKEKTIELLRRGRTASVEPPATGERPNGADEPVGGLR